MIHTLSLHNVVCELYFEKAGKKETHYFLFIFSITIYTKLSTKHGKEKVVSIFRKTIAINE